MTTVEPEQGGCGILLTVAYHGRGFSGFAPQPGRRTVADHLASAVRSLDPSASRLRAVSRTDAGVHARGQRVCFDTGLRWPPRAWAHRLNQLLGAEVSVARASRVAQRWDPRDHVLDKSYHYRLLRSAVRDPLLADTTWRVPERLNHETLRAELDALCGEHDFAAFRSSSDRRAHTVRRVMEAKLVENAVDPRVLTVCVRGDRFLHHMVRILVGTVVDVARGRLAAGAVRRGFTTRDRGALGITAPPEGLVLDSVTLAEEGTDAWP